MEQKKKPVLKSVLSIMLTLAMVLGVMPFMPGSMVVQADSHDGFSIPDAEERLKLIASFENRKSP